MGNGGYLYNAIGGTASEPYLLIYELPYKQYWQNQSLLLPKMRSR